MLLIRHTSKAYRNGKSEEFSCDPEITPEGITKAESKFKEYIKIYGLPNKIVCSPFIRTRQTAEVLRDLMKIEYETVIEIEVAPGISEYLGHQQNFNKITDVREDTQKYDIPYEKNFGHFISRVKKFIPLMENGAWYITHGTVMHTIVKVRDKKHISFNTMDCYYLEE